jgi:hypothetical protein
MRHASLGMTGVYVDPIQLDVAGALMVLPALPLDGPEVGHDPIDGADWEAVPRNRSTQFSL